MSIAKRLKDGFNRTLPATGVLAQLYSNAAASYVIKPPAVSLISILSVYLFANLYMFKKTRSPFVWLQKNIGSIFRKPVEPSDRLKDVFENVVKKMDGSSNNYNISSYNNRYPWRIFSMHMGRAFSWGNELYIGPNIEKNLKDDELAFVIAHLISHAKNDDFTFRMLSNAAFFSSAINTVEAYTKLSLFADIITSNQKLAINLIPLIYMGHAYTRERLYSRLNINADQEALKLCPDQQAALSTLLKLQKVERSQTRMIKVLDFITNPHPENYADRIAHLEAA